MTSTYRVSSRRRILSGSDLDDDGHALVHGHGQGLGAAHPAEAGGEDEPPLERPAEVPPGDRGQGLVGPLEDALGPDVDPAARGHLPVHGQAHGLEPSGTRPRSPTWGR